MEYLFAGLLVCEADAVIGLHDALASPLAHSAAKVCLVALAHGALGAVCLHEFALSADLPGSSGGSSQHGTHRKSTQEWTRDGPDSKV